MPNNLTVIHCDPATRRKRPVAKSIPDSTWIRYRNEIIELHRNGIAQRLILERFKERHSDFNPTKRQLWAKMIEWGLHAFSRNTGMRQPLDTVKSETSFIESPVAITTELHILDKDHHFRLRRFKMIGRSSSETPAGPSTQKAPPMFPPARRSVIIEQYAQYLGLVRSKLLHQSEVDMTVTHWLELLSSVSLLVTYAAGLKFDDQIDHHLRAVGWILQALGRTIDGPSHAGLLEAMISTLEETIKHASAAMGGGLRGIRIGRSMFRIQLLQTERTLYYLRLSGFDSAGN